jgi:putative membrane protein
MNLLIFAIALLHIYFLILEMFLWAQPFGLKTFRNTLEFARASKALAANQGLYNGFLAAGLIWSVVVPNQMFAHDLKLFFLICVAVAGVFGAITVSKKIFYIQGLPALIGLTWLVFI